MRKIKEIWNKYNELVMYLVFGGLSFVLNIVLYVIFTQLCSFHELVANVISWIIVILFVFYTNKKWVFKEIEKNKLKQFWEFIYSRIVTLILEEIVLYVGIEIFAINDMYVKIFGQIMVIVVNYVLSKCVVFREKSNYFT